MRHVKVKQLLASLVTGLLAVWGNETGYTSKRTFQNVTEVRGKVVCAAHYDEEKKNQLLGAYI